MLFVIGVHLHAMIFITCGMYIYLSAIFATLLVVAAENNTIPSSQLQVEHRGDSDCECVDYWECVSRGGQPYSYCGALETSVCCILADSQLPEITLAKPKCGVKGFDSGHIGIAEPSEWPWHVAIVEEPGFFYVCGGSLIDESWVLTAAHCVHSYRNQTTLKLKARLGEYDVGSSDESLSHEDRNVSSIVLHPDFNTTTLYGDIALLRLQSPATPRPHIDVVCTPAQDKRVQTQFPCFLTGWGKTSKAGDYSHVLKEIFLPVWDDFDCQNTLEKEFGAEYKFDNRTLCAGAPGQDACYGDGGSPLVCQEEGQWYQHGIVSYGFGCAETTHPGVYTRVSAFSKWIQDTILSPPGL